MAKMQTQIIVQDEYGTHQITLSFYEDLSDLNPGSVETLPSFTEDSLYFPKSLWQTSDGVPIEMIVQDIYDMVETHQYGISLQHLQEHFQDIDMSHHIQTLIREGLIEARQMTPKCVVYRVC